MAEDPDLDWINPRLRRTAASVRAPSQLRREINGLAARRRPPRRAGLLVPAVAMLAVLGVVLALVLPGGTPGGPTIAQATAAGAEPISYSPLPPRTQNPAQTTAYTRFAHVTIPAGLAAWNFESWRTARLDGRQLLTLYYDRGDDEISYSVAARPLLRGQRSGFTSFRLGGRAVISWQESNHSCILSSAHLSRTRLLSIARS